MLTAPGKPSSHLGLVTAITSVVVAALFAAVVLAVLLPRRLHRAESTAAIQLMRKRAFDHAAAYRSSRELVM
jgi:hypothetical protein